MLRRSLILNLLIALLLVVGLGFAFFNSLNYLTNHGQEINVPKVVGKSLNEVVKQLKDKKFKVEIDSTYKSYMDPLQVLRQEPEEGTTVKVGRTIFILVNRAEAPKVDMPDLVSKSFRNAVLILNSHRFVMGDTIYKPDIAAGAVLEQLYNGKKIRAGEKIPYGSRIDLVVGEGLADYEVDVPNLIGKTWREARAIMASAGLIDLPMYDGEISDTMNAIVYKQYPEALNELDFPIAIRGGDMIDVHLMQEPTPQILRKNAPGSLKFQDLDDSLANVIQQRLESPTSSIKRVKKVQASNIDLGENEDIKKDKPKTTTTAKRKPVNRKRVWDEKPTNKKPVQKAKDTPKPKTIIKKKNEQDFSDDYE